jgi:hypothetical protein
MPRDLLTESRFSAWNRELDPEDLILPPLPPPGDRVPVSCPDPETRLVTVIARPRSRAQKYLLLALVCLVGALALELLYCLFFVGVPPR